MEGRGRRVVLKHGGGGFSLIELLATITIALIMAAALFPLSTSILATGRVEEVWATLAQVREAGVGFYYDTGTFPADAPAGVDPGLVMNPFPPVDCTLPANAGNSYCRWKGPYLVEFPTPSTGWNPYKWNNGTDGLGGASPNEVSVSAQYPQGNLTGAQQAACNGLIIPATLLKRHARCP